MDIETRYLGVRQLTREMLDAATAQDWDTLIRLDARRAALLALTPELAKLKLSPEQAGRLADIIGEMQQDNAGILEVVEVSQKHTRILLRMDRGNP
ncbi:MAG: flagellar protein FliT [Betaproteobacteria bacterium]|nr:flagellar protein FliT [Betaproteobacteria bacterium]